MSSTRTITTDTTIAPGDNTSIISALRVDPTLGPITLTLPRTDTITGARFAITLLNASNPVRLVSDRANIDLGAGGPATSSANLGLAGTILIRFAEPDWVFDS